MSTMVAVFALDAIHTDKKYQLGSKHDYNHPTYGAQTYIYVYNNSGGDVEEGEGVMQEDGTTVYEVALSGANCETARLLGSRQDSVLTDGYYGWVLWSGTGVFASDGTTTANTAQQCAANGQFTDGVVGTDELPVFALETEDPAGAGGLFVGRIRG